MGSSFYADVFKVHHHSTISFGVPTFIPFVAPVRAYLFCALHCYLSTCANNGVKRGQNGGIGFEMIDSRAQLA